MQFRDECVLFQVYSGYVDDPRNTDNSWMETVAVNFHDETGDGAGKFNLHAGQSSRFDLEPVHSCDVTPTRVSLPLQATTRGR